MENSAGKNGESGTVHVTDLAAQIRKLAEEAALFGASSQQVESAILAGIALVLEREPSYAAVQAGGVAGKRADGQIYWEAVASRVFRAMTAELLRELREGR